MLAVKKSLELLENVDATAIIDFIIRFYHLLYATAYNVAAMPFPQYPT